MKQTTIIIDSCAWNVLFLNKVDLLAEFLPDEFQMAMTKHVMSFQVPAIPEKKQPLRNYIDLQIKQSNIIKLSYFSFTDGSKPSGGGGWGEGTFVSLDEYNLFKEFEKRFAKTKIMGSGLLENDSDITLAVRSLSGAVILTTDFTGPLLEAKRQGGKVVYLNEMDSSGLNLRDYVSLQLRK